MRWFRSQIRQGSLLALVALAINLALSFGHVHAIAGRHTDQLALSAVAPSGNGGPSQGDERGHPDDFCPICMAAAAMNNAVASTPPAVPVQFASTSIQHGFALQVAFVEPQRRAFRSRGPPLS